MNIQVVVNVEEHIMIRNERCHFILAGSKKMINYGNKVGLLKIRDPINYQH